MWWMLACGEPVPSAPPAVVEVVPGAGRPADDRYAAAWILLAVPPGADADAVRRDAEQLSASLRSGTVSFDDAVRRSADASRARGGALGRFRRASVPPAVADTLDALAFYGVSAPVRVEQGWAILRRLPIPTTHLAWRFWAGRDAEATAHAARTGHPARAPDAQGDQLALPPQQWAPAVEQAATALHPGEASVVPVKGGALLLQALAPR